MASWTESDNKTKMRSCWVSLDEADNDFTRFWDYIVASLDLHEKGIRLALFNILSRQPLDVFGFIDALIHELYARSIEEKKAPLVIILDDYQVITSEEIQMSLDYFIKNIPRKCTLVIASRVMPRLSIGLLSIRDQVLTIEKHDLTFSSAEVIEYTKININPNYPEEEAITLHDFFDGWIAGIQLSAISIRQRKTSKLFFEELEQNRNDTGNFLLSELLENIPNEVAEFLFVTSLLRLFNESLCNEVTKDTNAGKIIEYLVKESIFIIPLDKKRGWYRYHQLFVDLLRNHYLAAGNADAEIIYSRASLWFEKFSMPGEAIYYAEKESNYARLSDLLEYNYRSFLSRGRFNLLRTALSSIPKEAQVDRPLLYLIHAWLTVGADRPRDTERYIRQAESVVAKNREIENSLITRTVRLEAVLLRATSAAQQGNVAEGLRLSESLLSQTEDDDLFIQSWAMNAAGTASARGKDPLEAISVLKECIAIAHAAENIAAEMISSYFLGKQYLYLGRLSQAASTFERSKKQVESNSLKHTPYGELSYIGLGKYYWEIGELDKATELLNRGLSHISKTKSIEFYIDASIALSKSKWSSEKKKEAVDLLEEALAIARENRAKRACLEAEANLARLQLMFSNKREAFHWYQSLKKLDYDDDMALREIQEINSARVLFTFGKSEEAITLLDNLIASTIKPELFSLYHLDSHLP